MAVSLKLRNLLFTIYLVPPERLSSHVPAELQLDTRDTAAGPRAFLATVSLEAGGGFPYLVSGFRQVNYRLYVRHGEHPGVLFVRSWVSSRAAAAAMNLAVHTEYADLQMTISDQPAPYSRYSVQGRSGDQVLEVEALASASLNHGPFSSRDEAVTFLTHRLAGFAVDHRKGGLSIIRVEHRHMDPMPARVTHARADLWSSLNILTAEEISQPLVALIQPEIEFQMNLPERLS
jgi:uncharacterized protein YqjF (DUF2071 family)